MAQSLCILGRQPAIGLAELESLYGSGSVQPIGTQAALIDIEPPQVDFMRLGGTVKFGKVLTILETTDWKVIEKFLGETIPQHLGYLPDGKLRLGLSVYDLKVHSKQLLASGLTLKKVIRSTGRSVRLIPNTEPALSSAQVLHNQLTGPLGWELLFIRDGGRTIVGQSIAVQDITAYTRRDRERPKRDARVGMLPPKLAQIIINLANGPAEPMDPTCAGAIQLKEKTVLDPFCGTGVVLQEALLMGYRAQGTDIEPRMIDYSTANLDWLGLGDKRWVVEEGDATNHAWKPFDTVACETYLGRPLSSMPSPSDLQQIIQDCNVIHKKFLRNLAAQSAPGMRLCIAIPAWRTKSGFKHLPTLDHLEELGYNRLSFVHADGTEDLIYHREGQIVARELVVLVRK